MAVPDNYNFSLQDVVNEIPGGQTSLMECFTEASASHFNPTYQGSKNSLRNFRDYETVLDTLSISPTSRTVAPNTGSIIVTVTSNTFWSISDNASWLSSNISSGSGNGSFTVTHVANIGTSSRTGIVTVATAEGITETLTINQQALDPVITEPISLGRNSDQFQSCFSPLNTYYMTGGLLFSQATTLYTNSSGTTRAPSSYYSDGTIIRFWNGNSFTGGTNFCLSGPGGGGGFE